MDAYNYIYILSSHVFFTLWYWCLVCDIDIVSIDLSHWQVENIMINVIEIVSSFILPLQSGYFSVCLGVFFIDETSG